VIGAAALLLPLGPALLARAAAADDPTEKPAPTKTADPAAEKSAAPGDERTDPVKTVVQAIKGAPVAKEVVVDPTAPTTPKAEDAGRSARDEASAREALARDEAERDKADRAESERDAVAARDEAAKLRKEVENLRAQVRKYEELLKTLPDAAAAAANPKAKQTVTRNFDGKGPTAADNNKPDGNKPDGKANPKPAAGDTRWSVKTAAPGRRVIQASENEVSALDGATGKVLWVFRKEGVTDLVVRGPHVWVRLTGGQDLVLDLETGQLLGDAGPRAVPAANAKPAGGVADPYAPNPVFGPPGADQEKRLRALEDRLDRLTAVVELLAKSSPSVESRQHTPPAPQPPTANDGGRGGNAIRR
jgi:hypothetical protein